MDKTTEASRFIFTANFIPPSSQLYPSLGKVQILFCDKRGFNCIPDMLMAISHREKLLSSPSTMVSVSRE
jgi:hypothetical protein